jgi:tetratricopeptide (TPR) repeat protein
MKQLLTACIVVTLFNSCGLFDSSGNATNGFESVLNQPVFKPLTDSIFQFPKNARLLYQRAELLAQNNQHDIAYYDYKKSWELLAVEPTAMGYVSNLFLTGRNKEALQLLKKCVDTFATNTDFKRRLGEAYIQNGLQTQAMALYDDMLKTDSTNFEALYEKAVLYTQLKDTSAAIGLFERAYGIQPTLQTGIALANLYAETKNAKTLALCTALETRDTAREFVEPLFIKGLYYSNLRKYEEALKLFNDCMTRDYRFSDAYIETAIILYEQKNYARAIEQINYTLEINYGDADAYYWRGRCQEAQGKRDEAVDSYYMALRFERDFKEAKKAIENLEKK